MAYQVFVCRRDGAPIPQDVWRAYVVGHPALEPEDECRIRSPDGREICVPTPGGARWLGAVGPRRLAWRRGEISAEAPDADMLRFLGEVARAFEADIVGEEGEIYPTGA